MIYFPNTPQEKSLGSALGEALGALAEGKALQLHRRHQESNAEEALRGFGFSAEKAKQLSKFDPQILQQVIKNESKKPSAEYTRALAQLNGVKQPRQNQALAALQHLEQPQNQPEQKLDMANVLEQLSTNPGAIKLGGLGQQFGGQNLQQAPQSQFRPIQQAPHIQTQQYQQPEEELDIDYSALKPEELQNLIALKKQNQEKTEKQTASRFKATKEERKALIQGKRAAENKLHDLNRFEDLEKEGKLDTPGYVEFLKRAGLDIPALMNPGSEEFQKIQANFINGAKEAFGGRISNFELESFMKTVPNLAQSPEGRKRVVTNLKRLERAKLARYHAYREILAKNGGIPPYDLEEQVEDRTDRKMQAITEQFKKDLLKPVPKGQNKFITGLQAVAGSIAGAPGSIIKGLAGAGQAANLLKFLA